VNLYQYAPNPVGWVDPLGLARKPKKSRLPEGKNKNFETKGFK